jgi:large subunit ribosomal protein L13
MTQLTKSTKPVSAKSIDRKWHLIDVKGKIVGRIAPQIAALLQGKGKTTYAPYLDNGDYVVVINAKSVKLSGSKMQDKVYARYSGYPGGLSQITAGELIQRNPTRIMKEAVSGMLPKNKLRDRRLTRLFVFADENHTYQNKLKSGN